MFKPLNFWFNESFSAFLKPTIQQKEAFGRFLHALSVASLVGAVGILFAPNFTWYSVLRSFITLICGVVFLLAGLVINKGE